MTDEDFAYIADKKTFNRIRRFVIILLLCTIVNCILFSLNRVQYLQLETKYDAIKKQYQEIVDRLLIETDF